MIMTGLNFFFENKNYFIDTKLTNSLYNLLQCKKREARNNPCNKSLVVSHYKNFFKGLVFI